MEGNPTRQSPSFLIARPRLSVNTLEQMGQPRAGKKDNLNHSTMVTGIRPSLLAGRIDVTKEVVSCRLVPSSSSTRLTDGHFTIDRLN